MTKTLQSEPKIYGKTMFITNQFLVACEKGESAEYRSQNFVALSTKAYENRIKEEANKLTPEIIICAAIIDSNNHLIRGHRHNDCIRTMSGMPGGYDCKVLQQGFITSRNRFVNRIEAINIQINAGKMPEDSRGCELFSEDLY